MRDAAAEALRDLVLPTVAAVGFALLALPLVAESGVVVRDRALLDGVLALGWLLSAASGLRLGARLAGQGLGPLLRPVLGDGRYLAHRVLGFALVLSAQATTFFALASLHSAVRRAGTGLAVHALACAGEAVLAVLLTALVATAVRPWLGAVCAGTWLWVGHLEQELLAAVDGAIAARVLLLAVPSVERLNVQGALLRDAPVDPASVGLGAVELLGWWGVVGLLLWVAWSRTDRA